KCVSLVDDPANQHARIELFKRAEKTDKSQPTAGSVHVDGMVNAEDQEKRAMTCKKCGAEMAKDASECPECGMEVGAPEAEKSKRRTEKMADELLKAAEAQV